MRKQVEEAASKFIEELTASYPDVGADLIDDQTFSADVSVRVKCRTHEQIDDVMDFAAHLTTEYYLNTRVYIQASASYTGPILISDKDGA